MTFRFPYIQILNLKEKEKEQAFSEFGRLQKARDAKAEELQAVIEERNERQNGWQGKISASMLQQQSQYIERLNQKIEALTENLIKIEEELRFKQEKLMEKQQDEKMWNHLRDKSYDTYKQKENKNEQDLLDEIATIRHFQAVAGTSDY
jgi:flagellar protein FliJ